MVLYCLQTTFNLLIYKKPKKKREDFSHVCRMRKTCILFFAPSMKNISPAPVDRFHKLPNEFTMSCTYFIVFYYTTVYVAIIQLASGQEVSFDCPSTVDMSWSKHSPAVYLQQWEGNYPTSAYLQQFFNEPSSSWNDTFSRLSSIHNHNSQAFCPWTYTTSYNEKRIPQFLPMARCEECHCVDNHNNLRPDLMCSTFNYTFVVLQQEEGDECFNGRKRYSPVSVTIPVACICLRNDRP
ncbi:uncharacterized protein [Apostichopus japonicus]|uniref:uncharacterized protein n=1 Tax=Stichopus japonicus TaxID=307972 RepID=UPI003AB25469